jgi:hypothetical protein
MSEFKSISIDYQSTSGTSDFVCTCRSNGVSKWNGLRGVTATWKGEKEHSLEVDQWAQINDALVEADVLQIPEANETHHRMNADRLTLQIQTNAGSSHTITLFPANKEHWNADDKKLRAVINDCFSADLSKPLHDSVIKMLSTPMKLASRLSQILNLDDRLIDFEALANAMIQKKLSERKP